MKVILARTAGFCKGVRRAMNKVLEASSTMHGTLYTDGPLIHNPQTIEVLEHRGVKVMGKDQRIGEGEKLFIRTHGIAPQRREQLKALGASLCDATCPDVAKIQGLIRRHTRAGYMIVIVGDSGHAEVAGLAGYAEERGHVVSDVGEVAELPEAEKVCVVAQSTLDRETYARVSAAVRERFGEAVVLDTICRSTYQRQEEVLRLAREADAVVVVGGKNSANTCRLAEISRAAGTPTFHVETAEEIDPEKMRKFRTVAVTAGASTPNWILMNVVEKLQAIDYLHELRLLSLARRTLRFLVKSNILIATGAAMLCYANASLMGVALGWIPYAIAFCYILSIHLLTHFTDQGAFEPRRLTAGGVQNAPSGFYASLAIVSGLAALGLASLKGTLSFSIVFLLSALGVFYRLDILPLSFTLGGRSFSLRQLPASKDLFMALGWSVVSVVLPLLANAHPLATPQFAVTFSFTFMLVIIRSLFFDVRDLQGDQIMGRETLPTIIGTFGTKSLLATLTFLVAADLLLGAAAGWITGLGYLMLAVVGYICAYLMLYHRRVIYRGMPVEVAGDMQFVLAGILALVYRLYLA